MHLFVNITVGDKPKTHWPRMPVWHMGGGRGRVLAATKFARLRRL